MTSHHIQAVGRKVRLEEHTRMVTQYRKISVEGTQGLKDALLSHVYPPFLRSYVSRMRLQTHAKGLDINRTEDWEWEWFTDAVRRMDWLPTQHRTRLLEDIRNRRPQALIVLALTMAPDLRKLSLRWSCVIPGILSRLFRDAALEQRLTQNLSASKEPGVFDKLSHLKFQVRGWENEPELVVVIMALPSLRRLRIENYEATVTPSLDQMSCGPGESNITSLCFRHCDISAGLLTWLAAFHLP
ncbi:MAG: hypothetical protein Q9190_005511 [Brigantiaea leucoxantha]